MHCLATSYMFAAQLCSKMCSKQPVVENYKHTKKTAIKKQNTILCPAYPFIIYIKKPNIATNFQKP